MRRFYKEDNYASKSLSVRAYLFIKVEINDLFFIASRYQPLMYKHAHMYMQELAFCAFLLVKETLGPSK